MIAEIFDDDIFYPITVSVQLPGSGGLVPNSTYDCDDGYRWVKGHNGHYEWWFDWVVQ